MSKCNAYDVQEGGEPHGTDEGVQAWVIVSAGWRKLEEARTEEERLEHDPRKVSRIAVDTQDRAEGELERTELGAVLGHAAQRRGEEVGRGGEGQPSNARP